MPRSHKEKTREFQQKMRTQGAAGFGAGPWKDIEESLGMDQSVVVDQEGNPVWSVKHTRKPRHRVPRRTFDRLLGGIAFLAIATLLTSVLAIYIDQVRGPGSSPRLADAGQATARDTASTLTDPRPPAAGFIDRPAIEVVAKSPHNGIRMPDTRAAATPETAGAGGGQNLAVTGPGAAAPDPLPAKTTALPQASTRLAATDESATTTPELRAPDSATATQIPVAPVAELSRPAADTAAAIEAITRQASPAAISATTAPQRTDEAASIPPAASPARPVPDPLADNLATAATPEPETGTHTAVETLAAGDPEPQPAPETARAPPIKYGSDMKVGTIRRDAGTTSSAGGNPALSETASPAPATGDGLDGPPATASKDAATALPAANQDSDLTLATRTEPAAPAAPPPGAAAASAADMAAGDVPLPGSSGRWIINLASYAGPKTAKRMKQKFEDLGVSTEQQVAEVNGKTMYRLRIASFRSRRDAEAYFDSIKERLGMESTWITKK